MGMAVHSKAISGNAIAHSEADGYCRKWEGEVAIDFPGGFVYRMRLDEAEALAAEIYAVCAREREIAAAGAAGKAVAQ